MWRLLMEIFRSVCGPDVYETKTEGDSVYHKSFHLDVSKMLGFNRPKNMYKQKLYIDRIWTKTNVYDYRYALYQIINGNTALVETLFLTNQLNNPIWQELLANKDRLLSKKLYSGIEHAKRLKRDATKHEIFHADLLSKAVVLVSQLIEVFDNQEITFPLYHAPDILAIRNKWEGGPIFFDGLLDKAEKAFASTKLRDEPDEAWVETHLQKSYSYCFYKQHLNRYGEEIW